MEEAELPHLRFSNSCLRIFLVVSSIVLWMQGTVFLLLGVFIHNFLKHLFTDGRGLKEAGGFPIASIAIGIAMIFVCFVINYFVLYPTKLRYFAMAFLLIPLFAFELVFFIAGFEYASTIERVLKEGYAIAMINYDDGFLINIALNFLQWMLGCCGANDFMDWYTTAWANGKMEVPESCCIDVKQCHNLEPVMVDDINQRGCDEKIAAIIKSHNIGLILSIICTALTQIIGIVLSVSLGIKEVEKTQISSQRPLL